MVNANDGDQFNDIKYHYDGNGNAHLGAHFTPVADRVHSSSDKVKDGTIELGGKEINSGSVVLSVGDVTLSNEQLTNFEETANGYEISSFLDIKLDLVIYKGSETDVWSNELKELKYFFMKFEIIQKRNDDYFFNFNFLNFYIKLLNLKDVVNSIMRFMSNDNELFLEKILFYCYLCEIIVKNIHVDFFYEYENE